MTTPLWERATEEELESGRRTEEPKPYTPSVQILLVSAVSGTIVSFLLPLDVFGLCLLVIALYLTLNVPFYLHWVREVEKWEHSATEPWKIEGLVCKKCFHFYRLRRRTYCYRFGCGLKSSSQTCYAKIWNTDSHVDLCLSGHLPVSPEVRVILERMARENRDGE